MSETELMRSEIAKVMSRAHPPLVMTIEDVADLLGYSKNHFSQEIACKPDFPAKLSKFKQPRWAREDVLAWAGL